MRTSVKLLAVALLLVWVAVPNARAAVTEDSTTWEGFYEADVLPEFAGWTAVVTNPAWVSVSGGILSYDTMQMAATGGATTDGSTFWTRANPGFDFVAGATIEARMRLNNADTLGAIALACIVEFDQVATGMWVSPVVQTYAETGAVSHVEVPLGTWTTLRVVAKDNLLSLYVDGIESPTYIGGGSAGLGGLNRLIFGDITVEQDAFVDIDYIRWTTAGAFVPEPISLCLLALGGLVIRRRRA